MRIEQLYTPCLSQGAYYIESAGEAAIIDPLREVQPYLDKLTTNGSQLKYIFETHFHADFVSGHLDLAKATGAKIVYGPNANTNFEAYHANDKELLQLGNIQIKVLHTPGHTMESSSYLLLDEKGVPHALFSGDTLFIGDVGRPDLAVQTNLTKEDLAEHLYSSLRNKIMPLPDEVLIYPAHGAGSACGKKLSTETWDTLGNQKKTNYALQADMSKEVFVQTVTSGLKQAPAYFPANAQLNKNGYNSIAEVYTQGLRSFSAEDFKFFVDHPRVIVLDTRSKEDFVQGHIPNSLFIGIDGSFAPWVGALIQDVKQEIVFIADKGREEEVVKRLARVGFDQVLGFLDRGISAWEDAGETTDKIACTTSQGMLQILKNNTTAQIIDVRKENEYKSQHVLAAQNLPLSILQGNIDSLSAKDSCYIHCASGYRSVIAASLLKAQGYENVINVLGGFKALSQEPIPLSSWVCPSTL